MNLPIFVVDAFASRPFSGNPAGVMPLSNPLPEALMQSIAAEMKHAETAFLHPEGAGYQLRWFTPAAEVDLCGHATLASAHILFERGFLDPRLPAQFQTRSGLLTAVKTTSGIQLDFPAVPADQPTDELSGVLSQPFKFQARSSMDVLVELENEEAVLSACPNLDALAQIETRGLIVTARSNSSQYDFVSRFFAPRVGVPEDPVTGSAHCTLAPYWSKILGKPQMVGYQASERGGTVEVALSGDRILLTGEAVTVIAGEILGLNR